MKKILILTNHCFMLWQFRRELIAALLEKGCTVTIGMPDGEHWEDFEAMGCRLIPVEVDRRGINPVTDLKLFFRYWKLLKAEKPDMVITYSVKPNIYGGFACRMQKIPYCVNVQGLGSAFERRGIAQLVTVMYKIALKKAKTVFFENTGNAAIFREKGITPEKQQTVLSGAGINLAHHTYRAYPDNEIPHFLYLGRIMKEKGIDELFSAIRRLHSEGERFFLDLVGFYEDAYKQQVEELEAMGVCKYHGFQNDPRPFYEKADCLVLPSYHEGMSNVLLEAAATGRPLITSDIPGCKEAVEENVTGFTCPVRDEDALYRAMKRMIALQQTDREAMGKAGQQKIQREFDKTTVVAKTVNAIFR